MVGKTPIEEEIERLAALARSSDPDTSHEAAASTDATRLMAAVLGVLRLNPLGLTTEEVAAIGGINLQSVTPRMKPLESLKLVVRTSERRLGASGRSRIVWAARGGLTVETNEA